MLAKKKYRCLSWCLIVTFFVYLIPLNALATEPLAFQDLTVSTQDNSRAIVLFNEKVYKNANTKALLDTSDLNVSIEGGTATLSSYSIQQQSNSRNQVLIILTINGYADGSEILKAKPAGAGRIYNKDGVAMSADAVITVFLSDTTPPELAAGYPKIENLTDNSATLKIKSNEDGEAYYVVSKDKMNAPNYYQVRLGYIWLWSLNRWDWRTPPHSSHKGYTNLTANTEATCSISNLDAQTNYDIYVMVEDNDGNHCPIQKVEIDRAVSHDATISSTSYTVDNISNAISGVVYGTSLASFNSNLTPASGASFVVYQADGSTLASDLVDGYKVKVTAQDGTTVNIYTVEIAAPLNNDASLSSLVYAVDNNAKTISGVVYGTSLADFKNNLTPASGAAFEVYKPDETTVATDLANGYKVKVTAQDTTTNNIYTVSIQAAPCSAKDITSFSFQDLTPAVIGSINGTSIYLTVPYATDLTVLKASFASSAGSTLSVNGVIQESGNTSKDYTNPVDFTVTAEDGSAKIYTVTVSKAAQASNAEITGFSLFDPSVEAIISGTDILLIVPHGTDPTELVATFTLSEENATAEIESTLQASGVTENDFSSPVTYTVTAQDGTTQNWTVTVVDELDALTNAVLIGKHLFQLDDTDGFTYENVMSALGTDNKLYYKSSNGKWYNLYNINVMNDLFDASKALPDGEQDIDKWYKSGDTVQNIP